MARPLKLSKLIEERLRALLSGPSTPPTDAELQTLKLAIAWEKARQAKADDSEWGSFFREDHEGED